MTQNAAPSFAVNLFLTAAFAVACRWIKRNPSSFLRFALFPFGGLNVERWPRFLLAIVRGGAILGFFAFSITFVDLLVPQSTSSSTPAVLCSKFAVCILVAYFALRGSGEPVGSSEAPAPRPVSVEPQAGIKPRPVAGKPVQSGTQEGSVKDRISPVAKTPPLGAGSRSVSRSEGTSVPVTPGASAPVPSGLGKPLLAEVEAPPVPKRSYPLSPPPPGVVRQRLITIGSTMAMGTMMVGFFYLLGAQWLVITLLCFLTLAIVILFFARNNPVGTCPFCGGLLEKYNRVRSEPVRCGQCNEISKFENERFSPYDPDAVSETPIFRSPLFENGPWPNGCVLCGAPPVRFDEAKAVRYQVRRLATPLISSVAVPHPAARATSVPYCEKHANAIQVVAPEEMFAFTPWRYFPGYEERMEERRRAFLLWRSLPMMRRYLEANRQARSKVSHGYREPNLFQRIATAPLTGAKLGSQNPTGANSAPNKRSR